MEEKLPQLPHLVVEEPKRSKAAVFAIAVLSLLVLGLPIGLYLVSRPTQLAPQAAVVENEPEQVGAGVFLESKLSLEAKGGIIPVDVYVKSPTDAVNLVDMELQFDPRLITVDKIATDAASLGQKPVFNKWLEVNFDNSSGKLNVVSGLPNPGIKTESGEEKVYLATVHLKPQSVGSAVLQISPESQILRNSDNENVFKIGNDLILNLNSTISVATPSSQASKRPQASPASNTPLVLITNPVAATNYPYFKPLEIIWSSFNVTEISDINLYVNGEFLGPITKNLEASLGRFTWNQQESLPVSYIQAANTFQVEIIGVSKNKEMASHITGPFGILGVETINSQPLNTEAFTQNQLTLQDGSRILSKYLIMPVEDRSLDLNRDGIINELDLYLLKQNLLARGIIKAN